MINIIDKQNCSGCNACVNICPQKCITMKPDDEGFWYPHVSKDICIECGMCEKVCPEINVYNNEKTTNNPTCLAAWNNDENKRKNSSSGGIFTTIAEWILLSDGVVFGAGYDNKFKVVHKEIHIIEDLKDLRGSKYVQSDINDTYYKAKQNLDRGRKVLFSGTPCQIAGLYQFLGKDYEELYTCDLVCHGVPSPKVFEEYKKYLEQQYNSKLKNITFRNKDFGWKQYSITVQFDNNTEYNKPGAKDVYIQGFLKNYYLRPSCYKCSYKKLSRVGDITLGDFWGIANKYPELDDDKGTSLLLINTDKGKFMLEGCINNIFTHECDLDHAIIGNPCIIKPVNQPNIREKFFEDFNCRSFNYVIKKYLSPPSWIKGKITFINKILGFIKRKILKLLNISL